MNAMAGLADHLQDLLAQYRFLLAAATDSVNCYSPDGSSIPRPHQHAWGSEGWAKNVWDREVFSPVADRPGHFRTAGLAVDYTVAYIILGPTSYRLWLATHGGLRETTAYMEEFTAWYCFSTAAIKGARLGTSSRGLRDRPVPDPDIDCFLLQLIWFNTPQVRPRPDNKRVFLVGAGPERIELDWESYRMWKIRHTEHKNSTEQKNSIR